MASPQEVEFQTIDGLTLRGLLFPASRKGPGVVMTPGLNFPKGQIFADIGESFQAAGYTSLVFDPRSVGASDGSPKNDINPVKQVEDFHDAVSFLKTRPTVDPKRIVVWGYSLSASVAMVAAALDKRIKLVITACPAVPFDIENDTKRNQFISLAIRDRESRSRGNPPVYLPYIGYAEEGALFDYRNFQGWADFELDQVLSALELIPNYRNEMTAQSIYNVITWKFYDMLPLMGQTPLLQINAEHEELAFMRKNREIIFGKIVGPKELYTETGKGHMNLFQADEKFPALMRVQIEFIEKHLGESKDWN